MTHVRLKSLVRHVVEKSDGDSHPFVGLEEIESATGHLLVENLPLKAASDSLRHRPGDVLFSKLRPYLAKTYLPTSPGTGTGELLVLRPGPEIDSRFLSYVTRSAPWLDWATSTAYGTKMPRTSWELVGNYPTWLPPLEEQRRISDFLASETDRIHELQNRYRHLTALAHERARAVIDAALSRSSGEALVPVSATCKAIVDCVNKTAPTADGETPYRMIRTSNIRNGEVDLTNTFSVEHSTFVEWNRRGAPRIGDILFTREAPLGQAGILRTDAPVFLGQRIMLYRADEKVMRNDLLLYNFLGSHMEKQLRLLGAGSLHEHMRVGDGLKLRVHCPPRAHQDALVQQIDADRGQCLRLVHLANRQSALLAERRQALITAAVTGQFDVSTASGRNVTDGV
ncbi:hypothetical protein [Streptomyces sp. MCL20-2]|uniref:hypothetical protein n=1 Tax=Streptomyces sp. MCL20-2 TaxID=2967219 RepID=UPI002965F221|nr:hypothetical protein [Streptomyces sp. MCL20-2]